MKTTIKTSAPKPASTYDPFDAQAGFAVTVDTATGELRLTLGRESVTLTSDQAGALIFALEQGDDELHLQRCVHASMRAARVERGGYAC